MPKKHKLRVYSSKEGLSKEEQLAFKLAKLSVDKTVLEEDVKEMLINRIIDNASVAIAAANRGPVVTARAQALCHPVAGGAKIFGVNEKSYDPAWAAWANGTAVRELDMHDTFLAADYSHPADNIPPILAVAQHKGLDGEALLQGINTGYEIQVSLVKAICLHKHKIDHIAHLCPSVAGGLGALLGLGVEEVYQSIQQALHVSCTTRQSRKGTISSWKAFAPAHAGKLGIEAVDRCMRGEGAPSPIYEGEDSVLAWILDGPDSEYYIDLVEPGEPKRCIMETYTKEHSAEYQSQALIDLAFSMRKEISNFEEIEEIIIYTSHHTHYVIGSGSGDPQKYDPKTTRETLDHSISYIFAVALEDGSWHHVDSYTKERANRAETVRLWQKVKTEEEPYWTELYHNSDPNKKAFGGRVQIKFKNGKVLTDSLLRANAHPAGEKPFVREDYIRKFDVMTDGVIEKGERDRFINLVERLPNLGADEVRQLNVVLPEGKLKVNNKGGIYNVI